MRRCSLVALSLALVLAVPVLAQALPITWTLENVTFGSCTSWGGSAPGPTFPCDPGGTATGSFTYDAATGVVSQWHISVSGGDETVFPPFTWDSTHPIVDDTVQVVDSIPGEWFFNFTGDTSPAWNGAPRQIRLAFEAPLPDIYGTVPLDLATQYGAECYACIPYRFFASGQVVSVPPDIPQVPEPGTLLLLATGLGAAVRSVRRSRR